MRAVSDPAVPFGAAPGLVGLLDTADRSTSGPSVPAVPRIGFTQRLATHRAAIERRIAELMDARPESPSLLIAAARYAIAGPGKRLRPLLAMLAAEQFGEGPSPGTLEFGCALEMVHAASLILDDLPSMDDAYMRRGRPACHRRFGEDVAVLAAVSLLNEAYGVAARASGLSGEQRLLLVERLSGVIGFQGLAAGQIRDLHDRPPLEKRALHDLNHHKTGMLFIAAVEGGAITVGAGPDELKAARDFGAALGKAFQLLDDLVDAYDTAAAAGKDVGQDKDKITLVSLLGFEGARTEVRRSVDAAVACIRGFEPGPLGLFAEALLHRA